MGFGVFNIWMLLGLGAVVFPVLAHLLSRRRYDVVDWGAMQFLELGRRTRRSIRLQDWLLLLLRMLAVALVALALARPWGQTALLGQLAPATSRDVVFVLDGSLSMGREVAEGTPYAVAIQRLHDTLEQLQPGDTVAVLDCRDRVREVVVPATTDLKRVRTELATLPAPAGGSHLVTGIAQALQMLRTTSNASREVIVLTDGQALPWRLDDSLAWVRVEDLLEQMSVTPAVKVLDVLDSPAAASNRAVGAVELSRDMTVPDFPLRLRAAIRQSGGVRSSEEVWLEVDGQRLEQQQQSVTLIPEGETVVEFEHRFTTPGAYVVGINMQPDALAADDKAEAVVVVEDGVPVLVVDPAVTVPAVDRESYFLQAAFGVGAADRVWIRANAVTVDRLTPNTISDNRVVILCNISQLAPETELALTQFVENGGGLVVAAGDRTDAAAWNNWVDADGRPLLPADFVEVAEQDADDPDAQTTLSRESFELPWIERFRQAAGSDLHTARIAKWWTMTERESDQADETRPVVVARLSNGAPAIISRALGKGQILQLAMPFDSDWTTLPSRTDFVPFVHELVFAIAGLGERRNVRTGDPLLLTVAEPDEAWEVIDPTGERHPARAYETARANFVRFAETDLPGVYRFDSDQAGKGRSEPFLVDFDRRESNLQSLVDAEWDQITEHPAIVRHERATPLTVTETAEVPKTELWWLLLLLVIALLAGEVAMTRHMVQGGHLDVHAEALDESDSAKGERSATPA